jgi:hypothetical protein
MRGLSRIKRKPYIKIKIDLHMNVKRLNNNNKKKKKKKKIERRKINLHARCSAK